MLQPAWKELDAIAEMHMHLVGAVSAQKITDKILDALGLLTTDPYMGRSCDDSGTVFRYYRRRICEYYLCFYKVIENVIYVYHIVEGRTDHPRIFEN